MLRHTKNDIVVCGLIESVPSLFLRVKFNEK